ncbi:hypothetical protein [Ruegeria sp. HKCCD6157]|uniref:hypothetical protein n=1 Tax=Ruegeria sp. HKCCD6157 TaxID=2690707 RepID=UPI0019E57EB3|nr:hypothetical protein [Ruegeria sp. HKCCD6157]NOE24854.1 hypothetical protein [Ruegeria sp. HKCCD6157]
MRLVTKLLSLLCILAIFLVTSRPLQACSVCVTLPEASSADHIISADIIVLAGPTPDNPFRFSPVHILRGTEQKISTLPEIPFLIDSKTRAAFRSNPEKTVLFTYGATDKDGAGRSISRSWKRLFMMTPDRSRFVEDLTAVGGSWAYGDNDGSERVMFFAGYLSHEDHVLRNIAMVEIYRAPYEFVHPLRNTVPTEQLLQEFRSLNRISYIPVAVRLLGLQSDEQAASVVRSRFEQVLKSNGQNLYEWALAGIEIDGALAVTAIERALQRPGWLLPEKQSLIRALTEGGTVLPELRAQIIGIFSSELEKDRNLAPRIAVAMRNWGETALNHQFQALIVRGEIDPATQFVLGTIVGAGQVTD